jgi:hypothetical protein
MAETVLSLLEKKREAQSAFIASAKNAVEAGLTWDLLYALLAHERLEAGKDDGTFLIISRELWNLRKAL